jgi:hypothetical protein
MNKESMGILQEPEEIMGIMDTYEHEEEVRGYATIV